MSTRRAAATRPVTRPVGDRRPPSPTSLLLPVIVELRPSFAAEFLVVVLLIILRGGLYFFLFAPTITSHPRYSGSMLGSDNRPCGACVCTRVCVYTGVGNLCASK